MKSQKRALLLAIVIALATFVGMQIWRINVETGLKNPKTQTVCRIKVDLPIEPPKAGDRIEFRHVEPYKVPADVFGALDQPIRWDDKWNSEMFEWWEAARDLRPGKILLQSDLKQGKTESRPLVEMIPKEERAITIPVRPSSMHGGQLYPDCWVDVLATCNRTAEGRSQMVTRTVLQRVKVIAVDGITDRLRFQKEESRRGNQITLALRPEVCEAVELLIQSGAELSLILRNPEDTTINSYLITKPKELDSILSDKVNPGDPFYITESKGKEERGHE